MAPVGAAGRKRDGAWRTQAHASVTEAVQSELEFNGCEAPMNQSKSDIRARVLGCRDALALDERRRLSADITARILSMQAYRESETILAYSGFGSEFATEAFIGAVLESGCTLVLPRVNRATRRLDLYRVTDPQRQLVAGSWGIAEPDPQVCAPVSPAAVDMVLVPGVAFDRHGARVGYGGGYYDKLFEACFALGGRPRMLAPTFGCQVVDAVPVEPHDVLVDHVITEAECFSVAGA
jgi:5-formyltetrahydrofolate cyclo-ligase